MSGSPVVPSKSPDQWSVSEVGEWLTSVGMEAEHVSLFTKQQINGEALFEMQTDDYNALSIPMGVRLRVQKHIALFKQKDSSSSTSTSATTTSVTTTTTTTSPSASSSSPPPSSSSPASATTSTSPVNDSPKPTTANAPQTTTTNNSAAVAAAAAPVVVNASANGALSPRSGQNRGKLGRAYARLRGRAPSIKDIQLSDPRNFHHVAGVQFDEGEFVGRGEVPESVKNVLEERGAKIRSANPPPLPAKLAFQQHDVGSALSTGTAAPSVAADATAIAVAATTANNNEANVKISAPAAPKPQSSASASTSFKLAKVLFDYEAQTAEELTLVCGQEVRILEQDESGWWHAATADGSSTGFVPAEFVDVIVAEVVSATPTEAEAATTTTTETTAPSATAPSATDAAAAVDASKVESEDKIDHDLRGEPNREMSSWLVSLVAPEPSTATETPEQLVALLRSAKTDETLRAALNGVKRRAEQQSDDVRSLGIVVPVLIRLLSATLSSHNNNNNTTNPLQLSAEALRDVLECLLALVTSPVSVSNGFDGIAGQTSRFLLSRASPQFANSEAVIESAGAVGALLGVAQTGDQYVCFNVTQLLAILVANHAEAMQRAVVQTQQAVPQLMNLLADSRELIRNEALLLMIELTAHNQEIQKIVAFEGAFDRLFGIASADEERTNGRGSPVVHGCLQLICTLLRGNVSNQNFFRETSCVQRIPPLLTLADSEQRVLSESKHRTLELTLELVTLLVAGNNSATPKNQSALARAGTLTLLLHLALAGVGSPLVRIKALHALGGVLKGHQGNVARFNQSSVARSNDQRDPSVVCVVLAALGASSLAERRAALATFADYLHENEADQQAIAASASWPSATVSGPPSAGQLLVGVLFKRQSWGEDPYRAWFSASALVCVYRENSRAKQTALVRPLSGDSGPSLIMRLRDTLISSSGGAPRVLVGLLRLGIAAALDSPPIGAALLGFTWEEGNTTTMVDQRALPALVSLVTAGRVDAATSAAPPAEDETASEDRRLHVRGCAALLLSLVLTLTAPTKTGGATSSLRSDLLALIKHRLGGDQFVSILSTLRRSADFARAERAPLTSSTDPESEDTSQQVSFYYDSSFVIAFKEICEEVESQLRYPTQARRRPIAVAAPVAVVAPEPSSVSRSNSTSSSVASTDSVKPTPQQPPAARPPNPAPSPPPRPAAATATQPTAATQQKPDDDMIAQYIEMIGVQRREIDSLRTALGNKPAPTTVDEKAAERELAQLRERLSKTRDELVDVRNEADELQRRLADRNEVIEGMQRQQQNGHAEHIDDNDVREELDSVRDQLTQFRIDASRKEQALLDRVDDLENDVFERDERIAKLVDTPPPPPKQVAVSVDDVALKKRVRELERDVQRARDEFRALEHEQETLMGDMAQLEIDNTNFRERLMALGDQF